MPESYLADANRRVTNQSRANADRREAMRKGEREMRSRPVHGRSGCPAGPSRTRIKAAADLLSETLLLSV